MIRVCKLDAVGTMSFPTVADDGLHDLLGGYLEPIPLPEPLDEDGYIGLVDEEGLLKQLPQNGYSFLGYLQGGLVGTVIITKYDGTPDFVSLTDSDVAFLELYFGGPRMVVLG